MRSYYVLVLRAVLVDYTHKYALHTADIQQTYNSSNCVCNCAIAAKFAGMTVFPHCNLSLSLPWYESLLSVQFPLIRIKYWKLSTLPTFNLTSHVCVTYQRQNLTFPNDPRIPANRWYIQ